MSLTALDSLIRINENNYPQTLLEEWKYITKTIKIENFINDDLDSSSSDESDNESENGFDNRSDSESND